MLHDGPDEERGVVDAPSLDAIEIVSRILAAGLLGGAVGFEREFSDQPAGFRTHILVSMGAALFTMVGAYGAAEFFGGDNTVRFDPTRVAAQIVTGIGFLGAGAIMRQGLNVRGLTTAAALWVTAAIGTAVGLGYWTGAVAAAAGTVLTLYGLKALSRSVFVRMRRGKQRYVVAIDPQLKLADLATILEERLARMDSMKIIEDDDDGKLLILSVALLPNISSEDVANALRDIDGVRRVEWSS
jgi:putative Mg2+ transporter-C (MgtC) family protein